ncbi:MAG: hypothetical protein IPH09_10290 [bacterium]|nr:hypothetical protein [bacterium]
MRGHRAPGAAADLEARPDGRWLLRRGGRRFLLPADLARRLRDGGDPDDLCGLLDAASRRRRPRLRATLLPARVVQTLADRLAPAAGWPALTAFAAAGLVLCCLAVALPVQAGEAAPRYWPQALIAAATVVLAAVVHELGHAAALHRGGGRAGAIGAGLQWVVPVLWCDVTEAALLARSDRLRVDVAGVAAQLPLGGSLLCAGRVWSRPELSWAGGAIVTAIVWNALPFARTDAYWLLCDVLGVPSLSRVFPAEAPRRVRRLRAWWQAGRCLFVAGLAAAAVAKVVAWAGGVPVP